MENTSIEIIITGGGCEGKTLLADEIVKLLSVFGIKAYSRENFDFGYGGKSRDIITIQEKRRGVAKKILKHNYPREQL